MVRLYKNFNISKNHKGSIILIGNFDGVHLGHQKLFKLAKSYKKKHGLKIGVINLKSHNLFSILQAMKNIGYKTKTVSYTHLTLPTMFEV